MFQLKITSCVLMLLLLGSMLTLSESQRRNNRKSNGRFGGLFRFQQRRSEAEETENRRTCMVLSGLFRRRECAVEPNTICRMYAFLIKNGDFDCEQFPCSGYGGDSRSVCVPTGTCSRLTLSNGLCTQESECCIPANGD